jgi:hypothetical protein
MKNNFVRMKRNIFTDLHKCLIAITIISTLATFPMVAKEIKYKVADIPKELKENAKSVVRINQMEFVVKSLNNATLKVTYAITVLNKNGIDDALFNEYYDKFTKISSIAGKVYDENGEQIKKIPSDEIFDISAISGFSLYEDNRRKYIDPKIRTLPFTIEYSYEMDYSGLFIYPQWNPYSDYNISIEKSSYKIITPKNLPVRYFEKNIEKKVSITSDANNDIFYWEVSNQKALQYEPYCPSFMEIMPIVYSGPVNFEYGGYSGNMSTWQNLGKWRYQLGVDRNTVPLETKNLILQLTAGLTNDFDKVKKIYEFMQNKVRYVSIQMGIGGLQPFEASVVDKFSYGDCKALSNYMKSLLEVVGINSNVIWAFAGHIPYELVKEFPSYYFNHDFLCVPLNNDTLWLECTSQRNPCGYIGKGTDDRDVLLIDKENSKIVHTRAYSAKDNLEARKVVVSFSSLTSGEAKVKANYRGVEYEQIESIYYSDDADKKKMINDRIDLPGFELKSFSYKDNRAIVPSFDETLDISFKNYGTIAGQRVFMPINFMNRFNSIPERVRNRKTDVTVRRAYTEVDTVIYELASGMKIEVLPPTTEIKTQFGTYNAKAEVVDKKLVYTRIFVMNKGKYPPTAYPDLLDFFEKISTADRAQCSLTL